MKIWILSGVVLVLGSGYAAVLKVRYDLRFSRGILLVLAGIISAIAVSKALVGVLEHFMGIHQFNDFEGFVYIAVSAVMWEAVDAVARRWRASKGR